MNKTKLITILTVLGGIVLASSVFAAATISFSPVNVNVVQGENFDLVVSINPQGVKSYTTKAELEYPADLLEVKSFNFGSNWMALSASGYDLIDNTNGILIKTAGYPGGLSSAVAFGTVSFTAKKSGSGVIGLGSNSMVLNAENQDILSGSIVQTAVNIAAPAPVPTIPAAPVAPSVKTPKAETPVFSEDAKEDEGKDEGEGLGTKDEVSEKQDDEQVIVLDQEEENNQGSFLAGIAGLGSGEWLIILGIVLLVLGILFAIRKRKRGRRIK